MTNSKNLSNTSPAKEFQIPLKGFYVEVECRKVGWKKMVEGMGNGRSRIHMVRIKA